MRNDLLLPQNILELFKRSYYQSANVPTNRYFLSKDDLELYYILKNAHGYKFNDDKKKYDCIVSNGLCSHLLGRPLKKDSGMILYTLGVYEENTNYENRMSGSSSPRIITFQWVRFTNHSPKDKEAWGLRAYGDAYYKLKGHKMDSSCINLKRYANSKITYTNILKYDKPVIDVKYHRKYKGVWRSYLDISKSGFVVGNTGTENCLNYYGSAICNVQEIFRNGKVVKTPEYTQIGNTKYYYRTSDGVEQYPFVWETVTGKFGAIGLCPKGYLYNGKIYNSRDNIIKYIEAKRKEAEEKKKKDNNNSNNNNSGSGNNSSGNSNNGNNGNNGSNSNNGSGGANYKTVAWNNKLLTSKTIKMIVNPCNPSGASARLVKDENGKEWIITSDRDKDGNYIVYEYPFKQPCYQSENVKSDNAEKENEAKKRVCKDFYVANEVLNLKDTGERTSHPKIQGQAKIYVDKYGKYWIGGAKTSEEKTAGIGEYILCPYEVPQPIPTESIDTEKLPCCFQYDENGRLWYFLNAKKYEARKVANGGYVAYIGDRWFEIVDCLPVQNESKEPCEEKIKVYVEQIKRLTEELKNGTTQSNEATKTQLQEALKRIEELEEELKERKSNNDINVNNTIENEINNIIGNKDYETDYSNYNDYENEDYECCCSDYECENY